jgi:uncharacterized protein
MAYLVDGHNLIPKIPGLSLAALDDEQQLIELLQEFCRRQRKKVEVYFDNAPPGQAGSQRFGLVVARFVRQGTTADLAIRHRLQRLAREAPNWTVVSSDAAVQSAARQARAKVLTSEAFAQDLVLALKNAGGGESKREDMGVPEDELDEWLDLFKGKG